MKSPIDEICRQNGRETIEIFSFNDALVTIFWKTAELIILVNKSNILSTLSLNFLRPREQINQYRK